MWTANPWLRETFPNAEPPVGDSWPARTRSQRALETLLGERVERRARRVAEARLRQHHKRLEQEVSEDVAASFAAGAGLRFHGSGVAARTLERYAARRAKVAERLEELDRERAADPPSLAADRR